LVDKWISWQEIDWCKRSINWIIFYFFQKINRLRTRDGPMLRVHPSKTFGRKGCVCANVNALGRGGGSAINRTSTNDFFCVSGVLGVRHSPPRPRSFPGCNIFCVSDDAFTRDTVRTSLNGRGGLPNGRCWTGVGGVSKK